MKHIEDVSLPVVDKFVVLEISYGGDLVDGCLVGRETGLEVDMFYVD